MHTGMKAHAYRRPATFSCTNLSFCTKRCRICTKAVLGSPRMRRGLTKTGQSHSQEASLTKKLLHCTWGKLAAGFGWLRRGVLGLGWLKFG